MKFGKRLASEASRRWRGSFLDYKAVKRAIQLDVDCRGGSLACDWYDMISVLYGSDESGDV